MRWGMVIDLRKCIGCGACALICGQTNKLSTNLWRRVFDCGLSAPPERLRTCLPMSCMHCGDAPCLSVCPTGATHRRKDGIVDINYERCLGCGYCILACPYMARSIVFKTEYDNAVRDRGRDDLNKADPEERLVGVCSKCTFCKDRIDAGLRRGLIPGVDTEASPVCVAYCAAKAMHFGDLDDPAGEIRRIIRENPVMVLQPDMGTAPSVYYIME